MDKYKQFLKKDQTRWLLQKNNPSVRYFALKELLDAPENALEVIDAKERIMASKAVKLLLADQQEDGHWGAPLFWKFPSNTAGRLWMLGCIGADGNHPQVRKGVENLLNGCLSKAGAFRTSTEFPDTGEPGGAPCMSGLTLAACLRLGYLDDPRVQKSIEHLADYIRFDDGDRVLPEELRNKKLCQGKHSCIWGVIPSLEALAEIPEERRSIKVRNALSQGVEFVLKHHVNRRSHDLTRFMNPKLNQLGVHYQSDFLTLLLTLTRLNCSDSRMHDAVLYLIKKQTQEGKWKMQKPTEKLMIPIDKKGEPSKWVTLRAMIAFRRYFSLLEVKGTLSNTSSTNVLGRPLE